MPTSTEILTQLATLTRELSWVAIGWHVLLLAGLVAWRARAPLHERVIVALLLGLPLSVATAAAAFENPFNAASFGALALALAVASALRPTTARAPAWARWIGAASLLYAWCYPHFLSGPWHRTLYAAPLGVVPCPTLAALAGLSLVGGLRPRAVPALLALWAAFYALFGLFRLGVYLDAGLLVASGALLAQSFTEPAPAHGDAPPAVAPDGKSATVDVDLQTSQALKR